MGAKVADEAGVGLAVDHREDAVGVRKGLANRDGAHRRGFVEDRFGRRGGPGERLVNRGDQARQFGGGDRVVGDIGGDNIGRQVDEAGGRRSVVGHEHSPSQHSEARTLDE
ncbi:hypothetical protein BDIM_15620 [Brevundimonas diminuta ATCC 11568]|nr:hypothetical protein BDIM_15620 [Brevundimonas diminuta ATCC 11568]